MSGERRRPLKVGVELPIAVDKGRSGTPRWGDISRMARRAEDVGFDSVWIDFTHTENRPGGVAPLRERVDAACRDAGRDPATVGRTAAVFVDMAPGRRAAPPPPAHWIFAPLAGPPERLAQELRAYAAEGIDHVQLWLEPNTLESLEAFAPVLALLDS